VPMPPDHGSAGTPAGAAIKDLRRQTRTASRTLRRITTELASVDARLAQLLALQDEEPDLGARLDGLVGALDPARIAHHLADVVSRAEVVATPVPHAVIGPILPADVYHAAVDAIPAGVWFAEAAPHRLELSMPPAVAPLRSVVVWRCLTDVAVDVLAPAVIGRFGPVLEAHVRSFGIPLDRPVRFTGSQGRLVRRRAGFRSGDRRRHPGHVLRVVLFLVPAGQHAEYGSLVHGAGTDARAVPGAANTALAVFDAAGAHEYQAVPDTAAAADDWITYEFPIALDGESRRRLQEARA
jgi:hypothetical protein